MPREKILKSENPHRELITELSNKDNKKSGKGIRLSNGLSIVVKVFNPLLESLVKSSLDFSKTNNVETLFMENLVSVGSQGDKSIADKFLKYDSKTFPSTARGVPQVNMDEINKIFEKSVGFD